jgi:hypothetical protein
VAVATTMYVLVSAEGRYAGQFYNAETDQPVPQLNEATVYGSERAAQAAKAPVAQRYEPFPVTVVPGEEGKTKKAFRGLPREGTFFGELEIGEWFQDLVGNLCMRTFPVYSGHGVGPVAAFNAVIIHPAEDAPVEMEVTSSTGEHEQPVTIRVPAKRGSPLFFRDYTYVDRAEVTDVKFTSTRSRARSAAR